MQPLYPNRINWQNLPSFDTPLGASNLNKMDYAIYGLDQRVLTLTGYQDSASQSAKNAKASEVNAKASELNASASEEMARQYAEQAFSGTPEGYEQLVDNVRLMDIKNTTDTTLADSKAGGYKLVSMSGNSVQNGEPTPDYPVAIQHTGDCVDIIPGYYGINDGKYSTHQTAVCNKNKIPCSSGDAIKVAYDTSVTTIAIVYYNDNGYLTSKHVSNTDMFEDIAPSGATYFNFYINKDVEGATVGKITLTINNRYVVQVKTVLGVEMESGSYYLSTGLAQTVNGYVRNKSSISCKGGDILKFKTRMSMYHYIYYFNESGFVSSEHKQNVTESIFTVPSGVTKVNISVGNGSTTVDDVNILFYLINGIGESSATILLDEPLRDDDVMSRTEVNRKFASVVYDGSDDENFTLNASIPNAFSILPNGMKKGAKVLCTHYKQYSAVSGVSFGMTAGTYLNFINVNCSTVAEFKATLQANPIEVQYELAEPIIEELDNDSKIALNSLETFDTVTYINVDSRTQPKEIKSEYGTSIVGARTLKNELKNDTLEIKYNELAVALVATGSEV